MRNANYHRPSYWLTLSHLVALCGVLLSLPSCKPSSSNTELAYRRGQAENPVREKLGLRPIQTSWICFLSIDGQDDWYIDPKKDTCAVKVVKHDVNGLLLWETDSYSSGRVVTMDDNKFEEEIKLHCDYPPAQLSLLYMGDDKEIMSWVEDAGTNNLACAAVIERVKAKWFGQGKK